MLTSLVARTGGKTVRLDQLSKLTKIEDVRQKLIEPFDAPVECQRLFFRGKQLVDGHTLYDYDVNINDLIQLYITAAPTTQSSGYSSAADDEATGDKENQKPPTPKPSEVEDDCTDSLYKLGDIVDGRDISMGAWFEAKILKISRKCIEPIDNEDTPSQSSSNTVSSTQRTVLGENVEFKHEREKEMAKLRGRKDGCSSGKSTPVKNESNNVTPVKLDKADNEHTPVKKGVETVVGGESSTPTRGQSDMDVDTNGIDENANKTLQNCIDIVNPKASDGFVYKVVFEGYEEDELDLTSNNIRPRARTKLRLSDIRVGNHVMVNYNYDQPSDRGFWYDFIVSGKRDTRTIKELSGTAYIGADLTPLEDCKVLFVDEIFAVETPGTQLNEERDAGNPCMSPAKRQNKPECDHCLDNPRRKCKYCACCVCGGKDKPERQILCDECNEAYHLDCLTPPLESVPEDDEWYCPGCKTDTSVVVKAGEKLKKNKKKSKMASASSTSSRDWGKGMACVGRTKICNIVPPNHFGPVPGVEVGMMWKFRVQVSEAGCHRPHVAGIHGRDGEGAYSIVLSGGYEDDKDNGDEFTYTGSGGRDLSGNKRTAEQSCDQVLTRMNRALAKNCHASLNKDGADSGKDWQKGKPVRVIRNSKGAKHSKYPPIEGNRYDGIYKIVKYWPQKGKSGFVVWRYMLRRDDRTPPPWSAAGKKRVAQMGFELQFPEGYQEAQAQKEKDKEDGIESTPKGKGRKKRKAEDSPEVSPKKAKTSKFEIDKEWLTLIKGDKPNSKLWNEVLESRKDGRQKFMLKMEENFVCICCQDLVVKPVTLECSHNVCKSCLQRSFKADIYSCPACRFELPQKYSMPINSNLSQVLLQFFPGYEVGR